jgi:hypothetical protein
LYQKKKKIKGFLSLAEIIHIRIIPELCKMHRHYKFGSYIPSYLLITLNTDQPLTNIKNLDPVSKRTFVHEYTHFLQNISGGFGVSHIWNTYDRSRQLVSHLQKNEGDTLKFPLKAEVVEKELNFFKIRRAIEGGYHIKDIQDKSASVINAELYTDENFAKEYPDAKVEFVRLRLGDKGGNETGYLFGESAVSECMAYLMESKFFPEQHLDEYPYKACRNLGEYLQSEITKNDEWLFAICDLCLLSHYPGRMFYLLVNEMKEKNWVPEDAKEIYKYGIDFMYSQGWDIWGDYSKSLEGAIIVLQQLFDHHFFHPTIRWLSETLKKAYKLRWDNVSFILDLFREKEIFEGYWDEVYVLLGTPQLHNANSERYFAPTPEFLPIQDTIDPIFLLAMQQIQNLILMGKTKVACLLKEFCDKNKNGLKTDNRCGESPWERSKDKQSCAYGAFWSLYGLNDKTVEL